MRCQLELKQNILAVTALDVRPELSEALADQSAATEITLWAAHEVHRIQMHRELPAADGLEQAQVRIGIRPRH
ncbi:MAG: hypothetical protein WBC05_13270 [Sedimentisphaerales bacterium]